PMAWRMAACRSALERAVGRPGSVGATAPGGELTGSGEGGRGPGFDRSPATTAPPGPDPTTSARSTPASAAIRRARGDARTRPTAAATGSALRGRWDGLRGGLAFGAGSTAAA